MKSLQDLQKLDPNKKKIILWSIIIVLGIIFFIIWLKIAVWRFKQISPEDVKKDFPLPNIEIPTFEIPTLPETFPTDLSI